MKSRGPQRQGIRPPLQDTRPCRPGEVQIASTQEMAFIPQMHGQLGKGLLSFVGVYYRDGFLDFCEEFRVLVDSCDLPRVAPPQEYIASGICPGFLLCPIYLAI